MIKFGFNDIVALENMHYDAVEDYVKTLAKGKKDELYDAVTQLAGISGNGESRNDEDYTWLKQFILADIGTLRKWVENEPEKLLFMDFKELYGTKFSNGTTNFVDSKGTYNAYKLIEQMEIKVCPYCDDEFLDVLESDGKKRRTSEYDHYFPEGKKKYPALAMCFYNLILSGQNCNGIKLQQELEASPYDDDIEGMTFLYPDLEIGVNMECVEPEECKVLLHARGGMVTNEKVLGLKDRYANRYMEAYQLLKRKQQNSDEKIESMVKMGLVESKKTALDSLFGPAYEKGKFKVIHQKMKHDITGY